MKHRTGVRSMVLTILAMIAAGAGCQRVGNIPPDVLDPTPIATDTAMEKRQWDQSKAVYARTGVMTYPTLETWKPADDEAFYFEYAEIPLFLANIAASPYAAYKTRPWSLYEERAATIEPTYTAMPPLPPSKEESLNAPLVREPGGEAMPGPTVGPATEPAPLPAPRPSDRPATQRAEPGYGPLQDVPATIPSTQPSSMNK